MQKYKYLYVSALPVDYEKAKDLDRGRSLHGGHVAERQLTEALLRYSTEDVIAFPRAIKASCCDLRDSEALLSAGDRARFLNTRELIEGARTRDIILFSPSWSMDHLLTLRTGIGRSDIPLVSLGHSICSPDIWSYFTLLHLNQLQEHDCLLSPSSAGCTATQLLWKETGHHIAPCDHSPTPHFRSIPLGVNEVDPIFREDRQSPTRVLYLGRFSTTSKADLIPLLCVWSRLQKIHEGRIHLTLAGDDTQAHLSSSLNDAADRLGCRVSVSVCPNPSSEEKRFLLEGTDIFVSPSDSLQETFGLTILEAMSHELPVVVSDWSGYRELVIDGETGFTVTTHLPDLSHTWSGIREPFLSDIAAASTAVDLDELQSRLELLITNIDLRRKLGRAGRQRAITQYSWKSVVAKYDELWSHLREVASHHKGQSSFSKLSDVSTIFNHYASCFITSRSQVRRILSQEDATMVLLELATQSNYSLDHMRLVLSALTPEPRSVAEVYATVHADLQLPKREFGLVLGRLIKYGLAVHHDHERIQMKGER